MLDFKDVIIVSKSIIFKLPFSYSCITDKRVVLSSPFHRDLNNSLFNSQVTRSSDKSLQPWASQIGIFDVTSLI